MSAPLAPLANLYAFAAPDGGVLDEMAGHLEAAERFTRVWRPHPRWVVASAPLGDCEPDDDDVRDAGLAFAEGRDRLVPPGAGRRMRLERLAGRVDRDSALGTLGGDFGLLRIAADGTARVVRSCGGLVPFYLWTGAEGVAVSTLLTDHARLLPGDLRIDPFVHAVWTSGWGRSPDDRTFLADVRLLPRGHVATLSPGGMRGRSQYWDPVPDRLFRPTPAQEREHAARLRTVLVDRLTEDLHPAGTNLLSLSGGVDSSSLAVMAVRTAGRPVSTISLVPPEASERDRERSHIERLLDDLGVQQRWFRTLSFADRRQFLLAAPDAAVHIRHPVLCLLPEVLAEAKVQVLFGGELADGVCGSYLTTGDWDASTSLLRLLLDWPEGPGGRRYPLRWVRHRLRDYFVRSEIPYPRELPELVRPELRAEYDEWWARQRREYARDRRPLRLLRMRMPGGQTWTEANWEATSLVGVRRSYPFVNRAAVELAFSCHPNELVGPRSYTKKLLRRALAEDVPEAYLFRQDKGHWENLREPVTVPWDTPLPGSLNAVVRADWIPTPPSEIPRWDCLALLQLVRFDAAFQRFRADRRTSLTLGRR